MLRFAPVLIEIALLVYCLIDVIQTPEGEVRNLPKLGWILLILILPLIGGIAWLVAGRPRSGPRRQVAWPSTQTAGFPEYERPHRPVLGPDDDPAFLNEIKRGNAEQEKLLKRWEEDLRRREQQLRDRTDERPDESPDDRPSAAPSGD
jgi:hypothetical protein